MAKTSKLRPHQRPIVTRFAFVMSLRQSPSGKMFDFVVPCEPEEATSFVVMEWNARHMMWATSETAGPFGVVVEGRHWKLRYNEARMAADVQDEALALKYGIER